MGVPEIEAFLMRASQKGFNVPVSTVVETAHGSSVFTAECDNFPA
jgi:hypothetical protein